MNITKKNWVTYSFTDSLVKIAKKNKKIVVLDADLSDDLGLTWVDLENTTSSLNEWSEKRFVLSNYINLTNEVQFRFIASDIFNSLRTVFSP